MNERSFEMHQDLNSRDFLNAPKIYDLETLPSPFESIALKYC